MQDLFFRRDITPMMMHKTQPFDSDDHIFELKHDGARCLAYIDKRQVDSCQRENHFGDRAGLSDFLSRNHNSFLPSFPELSEIIDCVDGTAILDGELIVLRDGRGDFSAFQKRSHILDPDRIRSAAIASPVQLVAFDIIYLNGRDLTDLPLLERKKILQSVVNEGPRLAISRFTEACGRQFFDLICQQNLEGIIAKRKDSHYYPDKRTKDWQKIKSQSYKRPTT